MSFLRRWFGAPPAAVYDLPGSGYMDVMGESFHNADLDRIFHPGPEPEISDVVATLRRDPRNRFDPDAVEVRIDGHLVGYLPRGLAGPWSAYLAGFEAQRRIVRCQAHVWRRRTPGYAHGLYYINLRIPDSPRHYFEEEARLRRNAAETATATRAAEPTARSVARSEARATAAALRATRRADGVCIDCGGPIAPTGRRGRPPVRCETCRGAIRGT